MKISLLGCGWFGTEFAKNLPDWEVLGTTTREEKLPLLTSIGVAPYLFSEGTPPQEILGAPIIVLNIPPFADQLEKFQSWPWSRDTWIIFISSTSVYGQDGVLDESSEPLPVTQNGQELRRQEEWIKSYFKHWTILRFGGLLGKDRHPGKTLSGRKNMQGGSQSVNLVHLDDVVGFTKTVIEKDLKGITFNVVSDEHSTREEFYTEYALRNKISIPEFDPKDKSTGKKIQNHELKKFYLLKHPRMIGKDL